MKFIPIETKPGDVVFIDCVHTYEHLKSDVNNALNTFDKPIIVLFLIIALGADHLECIGNSDTTKKSLSLSFVLKSDFNLNSFTWEIR